jgi:hypothetical protein
MATLEAIQPYVEHLFDDADVRRQLARASANLRGARDRAGGFVAASEPARAKLLELVGAGPATEGQA